MKITLFILLVILGGIFSSCATTKVTDLEKAKKIDAYMNSWKGRYQSELVARWGPPTRTVSDGQGGMILTYESFKGIWGNEKDKQIVGGLHYPTGPRQMGYVAKRIFFVNEKGIIYDWNWSGL